MLTNSQIIQSWLGLPVYVWQGLAVRRKTNPLRMAPPAQIPVVELKGKGKLLSILVIGDSSAAGVGVEKFEDCVAGRLPHLLKTKTGRPIRVKTSGHNSATSKHIRDFVIPNLAEETYDYIVLKIGTNDAKNFHTGGQFCRNFGGLLNACQAKFTGAKLIWSGIIDMESVPVLPSPLNKILGIRSRLINRNGAILSRERGVLKPESNWQPVPENFSKDGFHASSEGYRIWAEELAGYIVNLENH